MFETFLLDGGNRRGIVSGRRAISGGGVIGRMYGRRVSPATVLIAAEIFCETLARRDK